jgi:hydrogenase expression/formation protein HypC
MPPDHRATVTDMCLAIPLKVVSLCGDTAVGEVNGVQRDVSVMMTPGVKVGDYVIVHAGFAIQILDQQEAEENLQMLRQMAAALDRQRNKARQSRAAVTPHESNTASVPLPEKHSAHVSSGSDSSRSKAGSRR